MCQEQRELGTLANYLPNSVKIGRENLGSSAERRSHVQVMFIISINKSRKEECTKIEINSGVLQGKAPSRFSLTGVW